MGLKFHTEMNAHSWRSYSAIYAPFFQIMRLWSRARGFPNPWLWLWIENDSTVKLFRNFNWNKPYFVMFIVGSQIFLRAHKIFTSGAHMSPRKIHEVASLFALWHTCQVWKPQKREISLLDCWKRGRLHANHISRHFLWIVTFFKILTEI